MKKLLLGISSGVIYTLLNISISLLTAPYFLKFLSKEEFGMFYLTNNLIIWSGLLNVGLRGSFKLQLASALGKGEETERLTSTSFFTQCLIAAIVLFIGFLSSFFLDTFVDLAQVSPLHARYVFLLLSFSFSLTLLSNSLAAILSVHNRDLHVYSFRSIFTGIQAAASIILLHLNWGVLGLAFAALITELVFLMYMFFLVRFKFHFARLKFSFFDLSILKKSLSLGKWFLIGFLAQLLIRHSDLLLIEKLSGINNVTRFIISSKLYLLSTGLLMMILKVTTPQMIRRTQSDPTASQNIDLFFLKFFVGLSTIAGVGIYLFNERFIEWWVGMPFYLGNDINLMLMLAFLFTSYTMAARTLLLAKSQLEYQKISALSEGVLHLSLSVLLGYFFEMPGIAGGIALSSLVSTFITVYPLFSGSSYSRKDKKDGNLILLYVGIALAVLFSFYVSPLFYGKEVLALTFVSGAFLLLFFKDIGIMIVKITQSQSLNDRSA